MFCTLGGGEGGTRWRGVSGILSTSMDLSSCYKLRDFQAFGLAQAEEKHPKITKIYLIYLIRGLFQNQPPIGW